jgi:hypothetical protein
MTPDDFRSLALSLPEAAESAHMGHPDFRVGGKIFATLGAPDAGHGMVKLSPDQQALFVRTEPRVFRPANGAWGRQGCTYVTLDAATEPAVRQAIVAAWRHSAPKELVAKHEGEAPLDASPSRNPVSDRKSRSRR